MSETLKTTPARPAPSLKTFEGWKSTWCPGCGDFGVLLALKKAFINLGLTPDDVVIVTGIGCSSRMNSYIKCYALHTTHGRPLPVATAVKLANRDLTVVASGGDGDGYAIGMGHFIHAMRRNPDITYVVMDNEVYGLTKGQCSPTAPVGFKTKTSPDGVIEEPIRPIALAAVSGCTFIAQGFSGDQPQLVKIFEEAIRHKGFSLVNLMSPCVTYNKGHGYDWVREHADPQPHTLRDPGQIHNVVEMAMDPHRIPTGILYQTQRPPIDQLLCPPEAIAKQDLNRLTAKDLQKFLDEMA